MPFTEIYRRKVALLIRLLPIVAEEKCFALKGGTAINLFIRDMPRLSIDMILLICRSSPMRNRWPPSMLRWAGLPPVSSALSQDRRLRKARRAPARP
jgi:Nucleotidyl transferase AbiEii toxin, Type IV TA system